MLDHQLQPAAPPSLVRSLGVTGVLLLTLSVATPASSVFVIVPGMLQVAGTGGLGNVYAELFSAWPVAGGEYVAVARPLGPARDDGIDRLIGGLLLVRAPPPRNLDGDAADPVTFGCSAPISPA